MKRKKIAEGAASLVRDVQKRSAELLRGADPLRVRAYVKRGTVFILSFLLGAVDGPLGSYPLSFAVLGAARGWINTALSFCAVVLSTTLGQGYGVWRIAALALMMVARLGASAAEGAFSKREGALRRLFCEKGYIRVVVSAAGAAAWGCIMIVRAASIYNGLFSALVGIAGASAASASFVFLSDKRADSKKKMAGLCVMSAGLSAALGVLSLPFSLSAVMSYLATVYFTYAGGALMGIAVGAAAGIGVGVEYCAAFAAIGLVTSLLWEHSRIGACVTSSVFCCVIGLFGAGLSAMSEMIPEVALGAAVAAPFVTLGPIPEGLPEFLRPQEGQLLPPLQSSAASPKLVRVGGALESISEMLRKVSKGLSLPTKADAAAICSGAREKYCKGCVNEADCRGADRRVVDSMFANMEHRLIQNGRVSAKIVPDGVARRCHRMDGILQYINVRTKKAAGLSQCVRNSEIFASDYGAYATLMKALESEALSERDKEGESLLLKALSETGFSCRGAAVYGKRDRRVYLRGIDLSCTEAGAENIRRAAEAALGGRLTSPEFSIDQSSVSLSMRAMPAISMRWGRYAICSKRDNESGDSACAFENGDGCFFGLISDGMGSGREAAVTSGLSGVFLRKLLSAGCPMESALELLNNYIRSASAECFTTVDLMEADLFTGRVRFIKSGAAPSFVLRGGRMFRIHSKTVPVGILRALDAEAVSFELLPGDTVVMMSDGVCASPEDSPWIYDVLSSPAAESTEPKELARALAREAARQTGREDDITVCVMKADAVA